MQIPILVMGFSVYSMIALTSYSWLQQSERVVFAKQIKNKKENMNMKRP